MADKPPLKPAPSNEDGHTITYKLFLFTIILIIVTGFLATFGLDKYFEALSINGDTEENLANKRPFALGELFPGGEIKLGVNTGNKREVQVRNAPAGQIIGLQKKGAIARVMEGPVEKFDVIWWRMDFKDAPDGWVRGDDLSTNTGWIKTINFIPAFFDSLRRILMLLGIIVLVAIIILYRKTFAIKKTVKEKQQLKKEQMMQKNEGAILTKMTNDAMNVAPEFNDETEDHSQDSTLPIPGLPIGEKPKTEDVSNRRWKNIQLLISSYNSNDWKQAIIEADIILDEMLEKMGYHGKSIGEKLKQIESSDFLTLNQAWEAHKVRNQIAHQGGNYVLSKDEAERVIDLYGQVFKEFYFI